MNITIVRYRRYEIRAGQLSGSWTARAFLPTKNGKSGMAFEERGEDAESAIQSVKSAIDGQAIRRQGQRRHDPQLDFFVPTTEEFLEALRIAELSSQQHTLLAAHALAGDHGLTASELADKLGYKSHSPANSIYGKCGRLIAEAIDVPPPASRLRKQDDVFIGVLANDGNPRDGGEFVWVMYPELRAALLS